MTLHTFVAWYHLATGRHLALPWTLCSNYIHTRGQCRQHAFSAAPHYACAYTAFHMQLSKSKTLQPSRAPDNHSSLTSLVQIPATLTGIIHDVTAGSASGGCTERGTADYFRVRSCSPSETELCLSPPPVSLLQRSGDACLSPCL